MKLNEKMIDGTAVLTLKGDLLGEPETTEVRDKIHSLVGDDVKRVVIDLGGVNYVNSSGLGTLIAALTTMRNAGGELRLARIDEKVKNLFVITQLVKVFETYETVERALGSFKSNK
jgi:anti-sigma B factor antagonist